jgi:hypothetical protein
MNLKQQRARQRKQLKHRRKRQAEAQRRKYDPDDIRWIAAHEAGHAVAALAYGIPLEYVEIRRRHMPDGRVSVGFTCTPTPGPSDVEGWDTEDIWPYLVQTMARPAAEARVNPGWAHSSGQDAYDRQDAMRLAAWIICGAVVTPQGHVVPREDPRTHTGEIEAQCRLAEAGAALFVAQNQKVMVHPDLARAAAGERTPGWLGGCG